MSLLRSSCLLLLQTCTALRLAPAQTRRQAVGLAVLAASPLAPAEAAVNACASGANNCWSTASKDKTKMGAWAWPSGTSRDEAVKTLVAVLDSYPQEGQSGVDLGGWSVADDKLADSGYTRREFKSGIGNFARFFNNNKPFVDDLELSVEEASVAVRSSSRVGDSDLGVNAKRLNFIAAALREKGWSAPPVGA